MRQELTEGRIFTGGVAPGGYNVKVLWMFVSPGARARGSRTVVVDGTQLDGMATFQGEVLEDRLQLGYGPPAYASIIDVPSAGCWRLQVTSGRLTGQFDLRAVASVRS
jgi:hypothetical protein